MKAEVKPGELRINNLLAFGDSICRVYEIQQNCFYVLSEEEESFKNTTCKLEPIQLTEEILLSIEQAKPVSNLNLSFIFNPNCKIWVDKSNEEKPIWHYVWKGQYIEVEYFHHLQNIHYYLNNFEELTIKTK